MPHHHTCIQPLHHPMCDFSFCTNEVLEKEERSEPCCDAFSLIIQGYSLNKKASGMQNMNTDQIKANLVSSRTCSFYRYWIISLFTPIWPLMQNENDFEKLHFFEWGSKMFICNFQLFHWKGGQENCYVLLPRMARRRLWHQ